VRIDIPALLVHERGRVVESERQGIEGAALRLLGRVFASRERYERAQRLARRLQRPAVRGGRVRWFVGPLSGWGSSRELPGLPRETFREWWERRDRA
jgi:L-lactate dehydrogenase complex protein LldF